MPAIGLILVGLVVAWLGINLAKDWDQFFRIFLIGVTNGALYALVALGYTLVYGILELINFAHGDVFMIGGMIAATVALSMFSLQENASLGTLVPAILVALLIAMAGCALLNATIERVAYRPLRRAPRLVPLITAIGVSFILQDIALIWKGSQPIAMPRSLPGGSIFTIGTCPNCVVYTWNRLFPILITVPVLI
ncbi:MAG: branched-chain amino acid ABC transporter permease, partial [Gaiellaceae bacterium]